MRCSWDPSRGVGDAGQWDHQLRMLTTSGSPCVAGALKLVQIPAGARHIQIEALEKSPHRIGECRGAGKGQRGPRPCPLIWGSWESRGQDSSTSGIVVTGIMGRDPLFILF